MLSREDFKLESEKVINWIHEYFHKLSTLPVKSQVLPGEIYNEIPKAIPLRSESTEQILRDVSEIILPGITHWQHPNFHAYFNANSSVESLLAEFITAAFGAQCMIWETSPAATELEQRMMEWMRGAMGLPSDWEGVIQDTASSATLIAIISAREKVTDFKANEYGTPSNLRIYCSWQTHSSIEKGAMIAGIGRQNVVKVGASSDLTLSPAALDTCLSKDLADGNIPCCVIASIGTTGTVAIDNIKEVAKVCQKHNVWMHIDAAYAGSALFLPEYRWMMEGGNSADSFVFNPHKWLFTNFDCTAYYVKDASHLIRTFEILPEYLKTKTRGAVNDYRDWGIALGRRFRALKLWFVLRSYGLEGIRETLRKHIHLNEYFSQQISQEESVVLFQKPIINFTCFSIKPAQSDLTLDEINELNIQLVEKVNNSGQAYLTSTKIEGEVIIRVVIGQTYVEKEDVDRLIGITRKSILSLI